MSRKNQGRIAGLPPQRPGQRTAGSLPAPTREGQKLARVAELYKAGRFGDAIKLGAGLTKSMPKSFQLWNVLGAAFAQSGQFKNAVTAFERAAKLRPDHPDPHNNLGNALRGLGQTEAAIKAYRQALKVGPENPMAHNNLSVALYDLGQLDEAENLVRKALALAPRYAEAYNNLGNVLLARAAVPQARAAYEKAIACQARFAQAHYNLGVVTQQVGEDTAAETHYLRAIQLQPNHVDALRNLGVLLKNSGALSKAKTATERALELAPDHLPTLVNLGLIQSEAAEPEAALRSFDRALAIDGSHLPALLGKAEALQETDQIAQATEVLKEACGRHPGSVDPVANLGLLLQGQGKIGQALNMYEQALDRHPEAAVLHLNRGLALQEAGRGDDAVTAFEKALELDSQSVTTARNIARLPIGTLDAAQVAKLRKVFDDHAANMSDPARRAFFAADLMRHEGDIAAAFTALCDANARKLAAIGDHGTEDEERMARLTRAVADWRPAPAQHDSDAITPIFLLGTSRSGKSLVEGLLAQSSVVQPMYEALKSLPEGDGPVSLAQVFYTDLEELAAVGTRAVTSTNPNAIRLITGLADRLQNATFVFVHRDPIDVGAEIFATAYARGNEYAYDARTIMRHVTAYSDLTDRFIERVGSRAMRVRFDDILDDAAGVIAELEKRTSVAFDLPDAMPMPSTLQRHSVFRDHFAALIDDLNRA